MFPFILFVSLVATYAMSQASVPDRSQSELSTMKQTLCLLNHKQDKTNQEQTILIQEMAGSLEEMKLRNEQFGARDEQLSGSLDDMERRNDQLGARVELLSGNLNDMERRNAQLYNRVEQLSRSLEEMKLRNEQLGARVELLLGNLDDMERRNAQLGARDEQLSRSLNQLAARVEQLSGRIQNVPHVGFSAYIDEGSVSPTTGETIPFPNTHINQGGHYNTRTSKYRCPVTGTYYFSFSFLSGSLKYGSDYYISAASLLQDGNRIARAACHTENPDDKIEFQSGNSVLTHCIEGSTVWLKNENDHSRMYGDYRESTFSGFLLYAD